MKKTIILIVSGVVATHPNLNLFNVNQNSAIKTRKTKSVDENYQYFLNTLNSQEKTEYKNFELLNIAKQLKNQKKILFNIENDASNIKQIYQNDFNKMNVFQNNLIDFEDIKENHDNYFVKENNLNKFNNNIKKVKTQIKLRDFENKIFVKQSISSVVINHQAIKKQINEIINNYFIIENDEVDFLPVLNYLNFLKKYQANYFSETLDSIIFKFNKFKSESAEENKVKKYIDENMWHHYENDIKDESQPLITGDSINGYDLASGGYWNYFMKGLISKALGSILNSALIKGLTGSSLKTLIINTIFKYTGVMISNPLVIAVGLVFFSLSTFWKSDKMLKKEINNNLKKYILDKKETVTNLYGFNTSEQFQEFLEKGFSMGFFSKLGSLFGNEAIKDRAYMIYDPSLNRNWVIDNLEISSEAHLRNWIGIPYQRNNQTTTYISNHSKTFFTVMNGVRVPFVRTYYGPVDNPYQNNYVLEQGLNWLTHTSLKIKPNFSKLSLNSIKNRFVYETYNTFMMQKDFYKENIDNIDDQITKEHFKNMIEKIEEKKFMQAKSKKINKLKKLEHLIYKAYN